MMLAKQHQFRSNMLVSLHVSQTYPEDHSVAAIWQALHSSAGWGVSVLCIATKPSKRSKHKVSSQRLASCCASVGLKSTGKNFHGAQTPLHCAEQLGWQFLLASGSRRKEGSSKHTESWRLWCILYCIWKLSCISVLEGEERNHTVWGTVPKASAISIAFFIGISETMEPSEKTTMPCSPEAFTIASNSCQHKAYP